MKRATESNKEHQELCFKSEKIFMDKLSNLINECKAEELDVGTVLDLLLYQSLSLVFRFTHTRDDALDIVNGALNQLLNEHAPEHSDDSDFLESKNIHQVH